MSSLLQPPPEDDYQPIAALNDLLYCERRCAMHRIEAVWVENAHTLSGTIGHQRADQQGQWNAEGVRQAHAVWVRSDRLKLVGKADVVEFHGESGTEIPYPVEYKRGKRRKWDNDDVQLCAQAMCLEEMLGVSVPRGAIFHIKSKRRREVDFTESLRHKTEAAAKRLHELIAAGVTPLAVLKPQCDGCSLRAICLPEMTSRIADVSRYVRAMFQK